MVDQEVYDYGNGQPYETVFFEHSDASGMSQRTTDKLGNAVAEGINGEGTPVETDPLGNNVGTTTPYVNDLIEYNPDPQYPMLLPIEDDEPTYVNGQRTTCTVDGFAIGCSRAFAMVEMGSAAVCPNNDCGPRTYYNGSRYVLSSPFMAYADGTSGFWTRETRTSATNVNGGPFGNKETFSVPVFHPSNDLASFPVSWSLQAQMGQKSNYEESVVKSAVKEAIKLTKSESCDKALDDISDGEIPSLNALVSQYLDANGQLTNISDGRKVSAGNFGTDNPNIPAFVQNAGNSNAHTYVNSAFFNLGGNKLGNAQAKAITLIHEAVHQFVKGLTTAGTLSNKDIYYNSKYNGEKTYKNDQQIKGSQTLTGIIIDKCYPALRALVDSLKNI